MKGQPDLNTSVFEFLNDIAWFLWKIVNYGWNLPEKNFSKVVWVLRQGPETGVDELALFCGAAGMANNNSIIPAPFSCLVKLCSLLQSFQ